MHDSIAKPFNTKSTLIARSKSFWLRSSWFPCFLRRWSPYHSLLLDLGRHYCGCFFSTKLLRCRLIQKGVWYFQLDLRRCHQALYLHLFLPHPKNKIRNLQTKLPYLQAAEDGHFWATRLDFWVLWRWDPTKWTQWRNTGRFGRHQSYLNEQFLFREATIWRRLQGRRGEH